MPSVPLGDRHLDLASWIDLARGVATAKIPRAARQAVAASRQVIEDAVAQGRTIYGVNTGFGKLSGVSVPESRLSKLQKNLLLSHATGVGSALPVEHSRLAFALRIHSLAMGNSGVRMELLDHMLEFFNSGMVPVIPSQGSVGASGDLAPLAHMALPLIGYGEVHDGKKILKGRTALKKIGCKSIDLTAKEGLALINGTQIMTAIGLHCVHRSRLLSVVADITCAATLEALRGSDKPYQNDVHRIRPHHGQRNTAGNLRSLLKGSKILPSHENCDKVQDAYSLRCAPQVHGAVKQAIEYASLVLLTEANAVTDNPLVFPNGRVVSAGNFHGQPVSQALDFLKIGISTLANISERRIENLVNPDISGLPPFLAVNPGLESGLMIPQVVAAALASENKILAHPASVDTIPTSANREDHVSMGVIAARHAWLVVQNTAKVLGIELISAAAGLDCGEPLEPGRGVKAAYEALREVVPPLTGDRFLAPDLVAAETIVADGSLVARVEKACGSLRAF